jgi:hypothetical protein
MKIVTYSLTWQRSDILSYNFIFHKQCDFIISGLKNIADENSDNNLESLGIHIKQRSL